MNDQIRKFAGAISLAAVLASGCGSTTSDVASGAESTTDTVVESSTGVRLVSAEDGAAIQADPPPDLVILDVRTLEEFDAGHLEGAEMIDFYRGDFATQLEGLDRDVPYLLYCRSGNRSGQTAAIMADLGFTDVADVDGGINAWTDLGLPTVAP